MACFNKILGPNGLKQVNVGIPPLLSGLQYIINYNNYHILLNFAAIMINLAEISDTNKMPK